MPGRPLAFQRRDHQIQFFDQIGRKRVGAGTGAVEQQPGNAVAVMGQLEIAIRPGLGDFGAEFEHAIGENVHDP